MYSTCKYHVCTLLTHLSLPPPSFPPSLFPHLPHSSLTPPSLLLRHSSSLTPPSLLSHSSSLTPPSLLSHSSSLPPPSLLPHSPLSPMQKWIPPQQPWRKNTKHSPKSSTSTKFRLDAMKSTPGTSLPTPMSTVRSLDCGCVSTV